MIFTVSTYGLVCCERTRNTLAHCSWCWGLSTECRCCRFSISASFGRYSEDLRKTFIDSHCVHCQWALSLERSASYRLNLISNTRAILIKSKLKVGSEYSADPCMTRPSLLLIELEIRTDTNHSTTFLTASRNGIGCLHTGHLSTSFENLMHLLW